MQNEYYEILQNNLAYAIPALLAIIANLATIVLIAIKDFPVFKPIVDKLTAHKEQRDKPKPSAPRNPSKRKLNLLKHS